MPASLVTPAKVLQFPLRRTIHNPQGKAIEGAVLAKEGERIAFIRDADGVRFLISIFQLSVDDQLFFGNLEDEGIEIVQAISSESEGAGEFEKNAKNENSSIRPLIPREILWHDTLETALQASRQSGRTLMLVITGDIYLNSTPLQTDIYNEIGKERSESLSRTVLKDTSFLSFVNANLESAHLDYALSKEYNHKRYEEAIELAEEWRLNLLPTILLIDPEGSEVGRIEGYDRRGPNLLRDKIEAVIGN